MKKFIKDIRFLIAVFVLIFVAFGSLAVNAVVSSGSGSGDSSPIQSVTPPEAYASAFYFKAPVLRLDENSNPNTSFLVITNQAAIVDAKVYGTAVSVEISPSFKISALRAGQAQIHLSARMRNDEIRTITCTVVVDAVPVEVVNPKPDDTKDPGDPGDDDEGGNNDDGGGEETGTGKAPLVGKLSYVFESALSIAFGLVIEEKDVFLFKLAAVVIEGDVTVSFLGNVAEIKRHSANRNFEIKFTAIVDGEIVATEYVRNSL